MINYDTFARNASYMAVQLFEHLSAQAWGEEIKFSYLMNNRFDLSLDMKETTIPIHKNFHVDGISPIFSNRNKTFDAENQKVIDVLGSEGTIAMMPLNLFSLATSMALNGMIYAPIIINPKMMERIHNAYYECGLMHFSSKLNKKAVIYKPQGHIGNMSYIEVNSSINDYISKNIFTRDISDKKKNLYIDEQMAFEHDLSLDLRSILTSVLNIVISAKHELEQVKTELRTLINTNKSDGTRSNTAPVILTWS